MSSMTERNMRQLIETVIIIWICSFFPSLLASPIDKDSVEKPITTKPHRPPTIPVGVPGEVNNPYGDPLPDDEQGNGTSNVSKKDQMCLSDATEECQDRCITLDLNCHCGTNGKTYRNICEMSCMRKVDMEPINIKSVGPCEPLCPHERIRAYKKIVKDLMTTKYLSEHVRRCNKISNCNQAKVVTQFATKTGSQSIMECPDMLPAFFLFTGLDCQDYVDSTLKSIFNNETVVNCKSASKVRNRLFNKKTCAWKNQGPELKELVRWSFDKLDANGDGQLKEDELDLLTYIPDQQCGESFFMYCDQDVDGYIREDEWSSCLGCQGCHRPCRVYQSKRMAKAQTRRYIEPIVTCNSDGSCDRKQCEKMWELHEVCWCVDPHCNEIEGTRSYAAVTCGVNG